MTKALREMNGKYIGNRPVKVRKSTWKERSVDAESEKLNFSLATQDKKMRAKLLSGDGKKNKHHKPHVHKRQKGMPW